MAGGYHTRSPGNTITAANHNEFIRDQVVNQFASTAARDAAITSPVEGMVCYVASGDDEEGLYTYTSAGDWVPGSWNNSWGVLPSGYARKTANQSSVAGAPTDITGLSVTVSVPAANRLIEVVGSHDLNFSAASGAQWYGLVREGSTELGRYGRARSYNAGDATHFHGSVLVVAPSAGSHTYKLSLRLASGSGTADVLCGSTNPGQIIVRDIGPAGAPT